METAKSNTELKSDSDFALKVRTKGLTLNVITSVNIGYKFASLEPAGWRLNVDSEGQKI